MTVVPSDAWCPHLKECSGQGLCLYFGEDKPEMCHCFDGFDGERCDKRTINSPESIHNDHIYNEKQMVSDGQNRNPSADFSTTLPKYPTKEKKDQRMHPFFKQITYFSPKNIQLKLAGHVDSTTPKVSTGNEMIKGSILPATEHIAKENDRRILEKEDIKQDAREGKTEAQGEEFRMKNVGINDKVTRVFHLNLKEYDPLTTDEKKPPNVERLILPRPVLEKNEGFHRYGYIDEMRENEVSMTTFRTPSPKSAPVWVDIVVVVLLIAAVTTLIAFIGSMLWNKHKKGKRIKKGKKITKQASNIENGNKIRECATGTLLEF